VPQDYVEAYKWYNIAAAAGDVDAQMFRATAQQVRATAQQGRDRLMQSMTPAQIAEGQRRSAEWRPTNGSQQ
jgi:TPR repeat protein